MTHFLSYLIGNADIKQFLLGRNDKGQLGHGDIERRDKPTLMESLDQLNIVDGACGKNHTLLLDGKNVYIFLHFQLIIKVFKFQSASKHSCISLEYF